MAVDSSRNRGMRSRRPFAPWILGLAMVAGVGAVTVLYFFDPAETPFFPKCPTYTLLGLQCPGCGSTRALHQFLKGNWSAAFRLNPVVPLLAPVLIYSIAVEALRQAIGNRSWLRPVPDRVLLLIAILLIGFGVVRNLPLVG